MNDGLIRASAGGLPAFRCEICHTEPRWYLIRSGDVVVSWACDQHLSEVCHRLQRDNEITELVVTDYVKRLEWLGVAKSLDGVAAGDE